MKGIVKVIGIGIGAVAAVVGSVLAYKKGKPNEVETDCDCDFDDEVETEGEVIGLSPVEEKVEETKEG